ncbi:MAG: hypothetical protein ABSH06_30010 [Thermodesulfobacteriota bacterium]
MISITKRKEEKINPEEMEPPSYGVNFYAVTVAGIADKNRSPEMMANKITA